MACIKTGKMNVNKQQNMQQRCDANFWQWMNGHGLLWGRKGRGIKPDGGKEAGEESKQDLALRKAKRQKTAEKLCANILWHFWFILFSCCCCCCCCSFCFFFYLFNITHHHRKSISSLMQNVTQLVVQNLYT